MQLMPYDKSYVPEGHGFINHSAMCYLNSLLQSLLSLPALFRVLKNQRDTLKNPLALRLLAIHENAMSGKSISGLNTAVFDELCRISRHRNSHSEAKIDFGQQDIHEAFSLILDGLEGIPGVDRLFVHRYHWTVLCHACRRWVSKKRPTGRVFIVEPNLTSDQDERFKSIDPNYGRSMDLNEFLKIQRSCTDEGYICPKEDCKVKGKKYTETKITMVPEILPILIKKYEGKSVTKFPMELTFTYLQDQTKCMSYKLVSQVEHLGGRGGGHYYATCERQDGCKTLNDITVSDGTLKPTENTYMLFYHYVGLRPVSH